jgi:tRNA(Ile2) C34 agmatinyltransferase TiaS
MALPGELLGLEGAVCECGRALELEVLASAAGHYLGYRCPECGPVSRETSYYPTRLMAEAALGLVAVGIEPPGVRSVCGETI